MQILAALGTGGLLAALAVATELGVIKVAPTFYETRPQRARFVAVALITAILFGVFMALGKQVWAERIAIAGGSINIYQLSRKALRMLAASETGAFITVDVDGVGNIRRIRPGPTAGLKLLKGRKNNKNTTKGLDKISYDPTSRAGGGAVEGLETLPQNKMAVAGHDVANCNQMTTRGLEELVESTPIPNIEEAARLNVAMMYDSNRVSGFDSFESF
jgi:hypothetical protein